MITSRQLEAFRAIMAHGTVTAAAERLGVSQPAVSKILAGLEHEIGYPLFTRIKRRLAPTSEARLLEQEVARLYHSLERVTEVAREIRERQIGDLLAQTFLGAVDFLLDFGLGPGNEAITFFLGLPLGFLNDLGGALLCLANHIRCLLLGLMHALGSAAGGQLQLVPSAFAGSQSIGDQLLARRQHLHDGRPYEPHAEPDEQDEHDRLPEKGCIDIHA